MILYVYVTNENLGNEIVSSKFKYVGVDLIEYNSKHHTGDQAKPKRTL